MAKFEVFLRYLKLRVDCFLRNVAVQDGWMTYDFTFFSTVFQSYQDDGRLIMKSCVQWSSVYS